MPANHDIYKVLGDPHRLHMIELLGSGEKSAGELERAIQLSQSATSQHLKLLYTAGLVKVRKKGNFRIYVLQRNRLQEAMNFFNYLWDKDLMKLKQNLEANE